MSRISALIPARSGRYQVEIDGEPAAILPSDLVAALGLQANADLSEALRDRIIEEGASFLTYERAVRLLTARSRSVVELRRRLIQAREEPARVERALTRLIALGFLDDSEYAMQLARSKVQGQGVSKRRFKQELFKRGVSGDMANAALETLEAEGGVDEAAAIEKLVVRKSRSLANLDPLTRQRRLWGFLARRGYDSDAIREAVRKAEGAEGPDAAG